METMNFREQLKSHRERAGLSKKELADILQISPGYITNVENGNDSKTPTKAMSERIAVALKLNKAESKSFVDSVMSERVKSDVAEWLHNKVEVKDVPLISWVSANRFGEALDNFPVGISEETVSYTGKSKNCFALRVKHDCMSPEFLEGDVIIVNPDLEPNNSDYVIVRNNKSDEATFKQFKKYGRKIILHPINQKYNDIELDHSDQYQVVGVVVEKVKKYR